MPEILAVGGEVYTELKNLRVWAKSNGGMGSLYRSQHEPVFVFKSGNAKHINNVELGKNGRHRTNVWSHPGANNFGAAHANLGLHSTVKPVALVRGAITDCSHRGGLVLENFAGSGSTLVAAHETGRRGLPIVPAPKIQISLGYAPVIPSLSAMPMRRILPVAPLGISSRITT